MGSRLQEPTRARSSLPRKWPMHPARVQCSWARVSWKDHEEHRQRVTGEASLYRVQSQCLVFVYNALDQGSLTSRPWTGASCQISSGVRLEIECTITVMCLDHLETIPPPPPAGGEIVFREISSRCQKGWGPLPWVPGKSTGVGRHCLLPEIEY